jgi:hypothetical protein
MYYEFLDPFKTLLEAIFTLILEATTQLAFDSFLVKLFIFLSFILKSQIGFNKHLYNSKFYYKHI